MYGIPGTLAGAVVGNAGAYGQEIGARVLRATGYQDGEGHVFSKEDLTFGYRTSVFKEQPDLFLGSCCLRLEHASGNLQAISDAILEERLKKYPLDLKCPGSFFKNVVWQELPKDVRMRIPADFVMYDKIPAGKLLEAVGAKGARKGEAQFAVHHANLLVNNGTALSCDVLELAREYALRVLEEFGIRLQPEILVIGADGQYPVKFWRD